LRILYLNIRSLKAEGKLDNFQLLCSLLPEIDVIVLVETWLSVNNVKYFNLPGFTAYHVTRSEFYRGGGIAIYINNVYPSHCVCSNILMDVEVLCVSIDSKYLGINILAIYNLNLQNSGNLMKVLD